MVHYRNLRFVHVEKFHSYLSSKSDQKRIVVEKFNAFDRRQYM